MGILVFTDNIVLESVLCKGSPEITSLFEVVLSLHKFCMKDGFIMNVIHTTGTRVIEAGIGGISLRNSLGGVMSCLNLLGFPILDQEDVNRALNLELLLRLWWGVYLNLYMHMVG